MLLLCILLSQVLQETWRFEFVRFNLGNSRVGGRLLDEVLMHRYPDLALSMTTGRVPWQGASQGFWTGRTGGAITTLTDQESRITGEYSAALFDRDLRRVGTVRGGFVITAPDDRDGDGDWEVVVGGLAAGTASRSALIRVGPEANYLLAVLTMPINLGNPRQLTYPVWMAPDERGLQDLAIVDFVITPTVISSISQLLTVHWVEKGVLSIDHGIPVNYSAWLSSTPGGERFSPDEPVADAISRIVPTSQN